MKAKHGGRFSDADAKKIAKVLEWTFPDGCVSAKAVLDFARPKNSPIHKYFDWDDTRAAEKYRLIQARKVITCVVVEVQGEKVRKYQTSVYVDGYKSKQFVEVKRAMSTPDIWEQILVQAMRDAKCFQNRYLKLKDLSLIHSAIRKTENKLKKKGKI